MKIIIRSIEKQYQQLLDQSQLSPDLAQTEVVKRLQQQLNHLSHFELSKPIKWGKRWFDKPPSSLGIYIWGPVGRGKTMLMDLFCQCLAPKTYIRLHFHRFMVMIHQQLFLHSGKPDPLAHIANELSLKYKVICFDEFFVSDIGDAMLLGRLYQALFSKGVTIISTSNIEPDDLYSDGLHRDRFLPTIKLIKDNMQVIPLDNGNDHRLNYLASNPAYFIQDNQALKKIYYKLTQHEAQPNSNSVTLCGRKINCIARDDSVIWFDFAELCEGPRSARDYIELASNYSHLILSNVPRFQGQSKEQIKARGTEDSYGLFNTTGLRKVVQSNHDDPARRFISLVDELYDCRVNLYLSAEDTAEQLYKGVLLKKPFKRTLSRLHEMSSTAYQTTPSYAVSERKDYS
jgi:cell division protein ZapE